MGQPREYAPALTWRAFFVAGLFAWLVPSTIQGQPGSTRMPDLAQVGLPDAVEAKLLLERFRAGGPRGDYYLEFELRSLPRRGAEVKFQGRLWGSRNERGAVSRVELIDESAKVHRWLLQNGPAPAVWILAGSQASILPAGSLLAPLIPGVDMSAFDLLMPYLFWPDFELKRIERIRGRPAHAYVFRPPPEFALAHPTVGWVRAYLDTQFNALMQAERVGADGRIQTTFALGELKKIDEQWMIKSIDLRNETTRDKTRFQVMAVAMGVELPTGTFEPARLNDEISAPRPERLFRLVP